MCFGRREVKEMTKSGALNDVKINEPVLKCERLTFYLPQPL